MAIPTVAIEAELQRCLKSPYLEKDASKVAEVRGELEAAEALYEKAGQSFAAGDEATGLKEAWGAVFRAARALVYHAGYRLGGLRCLEIVLEAHYLNKGLDMDDIAALRRAQELVGPPDAALARARAFVDKATHLVA